MSYKIIHLTSAHPRFDTRIFYKECKSLSKKYNVYLIVADGKGYEKKDDIAIYDVGKPSNRRERMFYTTKNIFKKALELDGKIYHIHDPELIFVGLKLKKLGKKVIFDSHEDVPKQILAKHYLNTFSKNTISFIYSKYEFLMLKKFDFVVSATPLISKKFNNMGIKSVDINNYPLLKEFENTENIKKNKNQIVYIGLLYRTRGIKEIVKALEYLDNIRLVIAGRFFSKNFEKEVTSLKGWAKVDFRNFVGREEINNILFSSSAGIVTLHPTPSYIESLPVKMFEYMAASLPVIYSDFKLWQNIIAENKCGISVNPLEPTEIAEAVNEILQNFEKARVMGKNGRKAVEEKYNWHIEENKLLNVYKEVLNG